MYCTLHISKRVLKSTVLLLHQWKVSKIQHNVSLTFDHNWNDQIESHAGCCGVDGRNPEIELIPASEAVAVKLWVFPPVCV